MIRQAAFTGNARLLKGGLHCHTTRSDGRGTPEEVITPATLREVYGVEATACPLPGGKTEVVPLY